MKIHNNHQLKDLRDKLNGSIQHNEDEELLQEQWNQLHSDMESQRAEDEGNWGGFGDE
ncbi:hypothetical protein [Acinetobacter sp. WCHAc010052]|uniref:hypothetical protein n=1 Tax=Acinetobacter sp. WCHAc010052 TaxID=2004647 RepID=UPI00148E5597|nr:hypothetical protein [Acinetobacter sp. WCHAc010052]